MTTDASAQPPLEALGQTDRSLRRILRRVKESAIERDEEFELEIRRAQRQLRLNKGLLDKDAPEQAAEQAGE